MISTETRMRHHLEKLLLFFQQFSSTLIYAYLMNILGMLFLFPSKNMFFIVCIYWNRPKLANKKPLSKWIFPTNTIVFHHFLIPLPSPFPKTKKTHKSIHGGTIPPGAVRNARTSSGLRRAFELRPFDIDGSLESTTVAKDAIRRCESSSHAWMFQEVSKWLINGL